jgi:multisubunit Na+/H+ antiporter MnhB subunit
METFRRAKGVHMISLLITLVVFALVCYLIFWAMGYLTVPDPIRKVVTVVIVLIAVIWILTNFLPGTAGWHTAWPR